MAKGYNTVTTDDVTVNVVYTIVIHVDITDITVRSCVWRHKFTVGTVQLLVRVPS